MEKDLIDVIRRAVKEEVDPINQSLEKMDSRLDKMGNELGKMDNKLQKMDSKLDRIEKRVNATFEQTAVLSEFRTETNERLDSIENAIKDIRSDVSVANIISSKNRIDIEILKSAKKK